MSESLDKNIGLVLIALAAMVLLAAGGVVYKLSSSTRDQMGERPTRWGN